MRQTALRISTFLAGAGTALALATPAMAQQAPAPAPAAAEDTGLGEIVVQARKVSENIQDVPVAITAVSGEQLAVRSIQRVQDIASFTPGLTIRQGQNTPAALTIALRGQVQTDTLITLDPSVGTYVDGVYWARSYGLNGDFLDVQSVQVLKGPQGTLFGRNTTGGAILINSNNPNLNDFSGKASVTYGRFNEFQGTAVVNIPIVPGKVALRLAGMRFSRNGYTTNVVAPGTTTVTIPSTPIQQYFGGDPNGVKLDNRNRWSGRAKLDIKPSDDLTLRFSAESFYMNERGPSRQMLLALSPFTASNSTYNLGGTGAIFLGVANGGPAPTSAANSAADIAIGLPLLNANIAALAANPNIASQNEIPFAYAKTQTYGFTGILDTSFGQVQLITGYRKIDSHAGFDIDGSQYAVHYTSSDQSVKQYSGELQVTGKAFDSALDYAAGFFLFHERGFDDSISIVAPLINPITSHQIGIINNDSSGAYGQFTYHFTNQLSFTGGLRYSVDTKGLDNRNNNYNRGTTAFTSGGQSIPAGTAACALFLGTFVAGPETINEPACSVNRTDSFRGCSYTAGLEYKPTDDILLYVKTAKGFRSGGQNLRAPSAATLLPFQPEIAYSYEAGLKSEFFDRRLRLNLAVYQTNIKNLQRSTLIAVPGAAAGQSATILGNAGKARFRGFEIDGAVVVTDGLRLSGFLSHVDPKYISYADLSGDRSFERFDTVTRWQWGASADFDHDFGVAKFKAHVDYSWSSATPTGPYNFPQNSATVPTGSTAVPSAVNTQNAAVVAAATRNAMGLLGARASVSFDDDRYEIAVFGRNLTNRRTFVSNLLVAPVGYVSGIRMEPTTYGVTATVNF